MDSLSWEAAEQEVLRFMNPELELSGGSLTRGWALVSLREASLTVVAYLSFVAFGSASMRRRAALDGPVLTALMATYNATQVVLCLYMVLETIHQYWALGYRPTCNNALVLLPGEPFETTGMSDVLWVFYVSKVRQLTPAGQHGHSCAGCSLPFAVLMLWLRVGQVLDFLDTVFIVVRKRTRQLSFLHVFHHVSIFVVYWINISIACALHINCLLHSSRPDGIALLSLLTHRTRRRQR